MNKNEMDIFLYLSENRFINQRDLMQSTGYSLGFVNKSLNNLKKKALIDSNFNISKKGKQYIKENSPQRAIILAAGYGMRMIPINLETPKALIEIKGEVLIERIINHLHEAGIHEIYIVVGFLKERFEYLIDEFNVELIVNEHYDTKNNLYSLSLALDKISNSYIVPCDIWCRYNPFRKKEIYSWYMVSNEKNINSDLRINRKGDLVKINKEKIGNNPIGISYLTKNIASKVCKNIEELSKTKDGYTMFWEDSLFNYNETKVSARLVDSNDYIEINTYEQLREIDQNSNNLKSDAIEIIRKTFNVKEEEINNISVLKKGMTNRSFLFRCKDKKYIMRIPGEGTDKLINRYEEYEVYKALKGKNICDDIVYMNYDNGYKITEFIEDSRVCDSKNIIDVSKCMDKLRQFHKLNLSVGHEFDIFNEINFYESLWREKKSIYKDYSKVKENVFSLKSYIEKHVETKCLSHIDSVSDNFLFTKDGNIRLIDWEYSGMQDPHIDIAMFCIYAMYDKNKIDKVIDLYFENKCNIYDRIKIYCYISVCGLLWSNWCEYKQSLGIDFGEYSIRQYRYAKEYYRIVKKELEKI